METPFIGIQDVNHLTLSRLNDYDLYNTCNSSKSMMLMCQQDPQLFEKYKNVHAIVVMVDYYFRSSIDKNAYFIVNENINLLDIFPHLDKKYNFDIFIKGIRIAAHFYSVKIYPRDDDEPVFSIKTLDDNVAIYFLVAICLMSDDFYSEMLYQVEEYKRLQKKKLYKKAKKSPHSPKKKKRY